VASGPKGENISLSGAADLTEAVTITTFVAWCRRWLLVAVIACALWSVLETSTYFITILGELTLFWLFAWYIGARATQEALLVWIWFVILLVAGAALWSFLQFVGFAGKGFSWALLFQLALNATFFAVTWRVRRRADVMADPSDLELFEPILSLGLNATKDSSWKRPPFLDAWFAGGWRTLYILTLPQAILLLFHSVRSLRASFLFNLTIVCCLAIPWFLLPAWRALRSDVSVSLLQTIHKNRAGHKSYLLYVLSHSLRQPRAMLWFGVAALPLAGAAMVWFIVLPVEINPLRVSAFLLLLVMGIICIRLGRRHALRAAARGSSAETETFTLYLRSFVDDQTEVLHDGLAFRVWLADRLFDVIRYVRFEDILAGSIWRFGKALALGRPGDNLPVSGALRLEASSENWKDVITDLAHRANNILMTVGLTSGLMMGICPTLRREQPA